MPRRPRAFAEGLYHLAARASDTRHLFVTAEDRVDFLDRLASTCAAFELGVVDYVLMGTHYHTVLLVPDSRVSQALQRLHSDYSRHHNRRHRRSAHLFRAHPMACEIESDEQLVAVSRYLARNPVEAGLVADPLAWPWSSARTHASLEQPRIPLLVNPLRAAFGGGSNWRRRYREFIESADDERASTPAREKPRAPFDALGSSGGRI